MDHFDPNISEYESTLKTLFDTVEAQNTKINESEILNIFESRSYLSRICG